MRNEQTAYVESHLVQPQPTAHPLAVLWSFIGGLLLLVFLIAGILAAHTQFVAGASIMVILLVGLLVILMPSALIVGIVVWYQERMRKVRAEARNQELEEEHKEAQIEQVRAQTRVLERTIPFDSVGNAALYDAISGQFIQLRGNYQEHPNLSHLHYSIKSDAAQAATQQAQIGPAQHHNLPKIEELISQIPYNSLQTAMGAELMTGKAVIAPIKKSTHFKLIGGSGLGKSCLSGGMLYIATQTNDADHLKIGLLDLEHNTSRLFEDLPHIAEIGPRRQRLIGRDPGEVAQKLKMLQLELERRAALGEKYCELYEPVLLVYVEEMLALKYEVADKKLKEEMLAAVNILGVRARKYGIFLLVCMQTDYSDKSTREAMAQFRTRAGFAIDPDTARAAGFFNTKLVTENFQAGYAGQYVLEKPQYSGLVLAPDFDVRAKLEEMHTPSASPSEREKIRLLNPARNRSVGALEGDSEGAQGLPLRSPSQASLAAFSAQEQRFISKFMQERLGISQIVASEFTNPKGEPLTSGEAYKQRSKEVQDVIRRYLASKEVS